MPGKTSANAQNCDDFHGLTPQRIVFEAPGRLSAAAPTRRAKGNGHTQSFK